MISSIFTTLGSFFLFASFILNLFILIGQLSNRVFINTIYFAQVSNQPNSYYNLGLWNYCTANTNSVQSCQHPTPAYNWATTPVISQVLPSQSNSYFIKGLFLASFILFFIGLGLSFILWVLSMPFCCTKRRGISAFFTTLIFINLLVMLAALIFSLVFIIRGLHILHNADPSFTGQAGNALWLTIGSVLALFFGFLCYTGACCCLTVPTSYNKRSRKNKVDPTIGVTRFSKTKDNVDDYQPQHQQHDEIPQRQQTGTPMSGRRSYDLNHSVYQSIAQPSPRASQQPYPQQQQQQQQYQDNMNRYSPAIQQQDFEHQPRNETQPRNEKHGHIRVPGFLSSNKHVPNTTA